jgi:aerobic C4-dicarboxylate transport protein
VKNLHRSLYFQVLVAIGLGVALGALYPAFAVKMQPLGEGFIKLVKMLIAPVIFCTVVMGIAGVEDVKQVGKTGGLALLYFEGMSTVSLVIGLAVANILQPGKGMNIDASTLNEGALAAYTAPGKLQSVPEFLMNIIPTTLADAFAKGEILQVLLISILFGFALQRLKTQGAPLFAFVQGLSDVLFAIVGFVMRLAPLGAFGAMAFTVGKYGFATLFSLGKLLGSFYLTCLVFILGALGLVARLHGFRILKFLAYIREELFIVLGTSSSESALPRMIGKLEKLGASKQVVGLVVPAGLFFQPRRHVDLFDPGHVVHRAGDKHADDLRAAAHSARGVAADVQGRRRRHGQRLHRIGRDSVFTVGTLPVAGLTLILGVDRFMSEARALTNVIGNGVATLVVAKWTGELDMVTMRGNAEFGMSGEEKR